jgi:hypothetical protein
MTGITSLVIFNNGNNRVKFAVFTEKALPVQITGVDVPYSHKNSL